MGGKKGEGRWRGEDEGGVGVGEVGRGVGRSSRGGG